MSLFALALASFVVAGVASALASPRPRLASRLGAGGAVLGSALGLVPALQVLAGRSLPPVALSWEVPGGSLALGIDALSAFFLVPVFVVGAACAIYGAAYLRPHAHEKLLGLGWLWLVLLLASMAVVATARNGLLFLVAWEAMALASFLLVVFHHERDGVGRAGWVYLVATHLGTAFLLVLFAWLAREAGSLDFEHWSRPATGAGWLFVLALVGFGSKAGLFPFHVWLPEAHPVAPSHVSALLSGVMVKLGIYGLLRILVVLGGPEPAWGALLLAVGLASAGYGAVAALAQRDLKRGLAYSTVENVGVIAIGLGLGAFAGATPVLALALAGGLLHVWNHALFKSLLFLAAGSLAHGSGSLDLERLGGLLRRMPWTGAGLLAGGAALCALPPWNGFASEFLIFLGSFGALAEAGPASAAALAAIAGLGLVGALAAAGFVRIAGIALLGEPRSEAAARATESPWAMRAVLLALSAACLLLGAGGAVALLATLRPVEQILAARVDAAALAEASALLWRVGAVGGALAAAALALLWLRRRILPAPLARRVGTWDCGYAAPDPRMQYTASSFAEPLTRLFAVVLRLRTDEPPQTGSTASPPSPPQRFADAAEGLYGRIFSGVAALARRVERLQPANTQLYVLYTALAALALLVWGLV